MLKLFPLKYVSSALLVIMLLITLIGVCKNAHAAQSVLPTGDGMSLSSQDVPYSQSGSHSCPCCPLEDAESDGSHSCFNCLCHVSLAAVPFQLAYLPIVADLVAVDPLTRLPDVYLSRFIPPQSLL